MSKFIKGVERNNEFYCGDDGFWHFAPANGLGYLTASQLREIADELDERNRELNNQILRDSIKSKMEQAG